MKPLSAEEKEDLNLAAALLTGHWIERNKLREIQLLSADTKPTEKEGRLALYRALMRLSGDYDTGDPSDAYDWRCQLLRTLASVFAPWTAPPHPRQLKAS